MTPEDKAPATKIREQNTITTDVYNLELRVGSTKAWLEELSQYLVKDSYFGRIISILRNGMLNIGSLPVPDGKSWQKANARSCKVTIGDDKLL
jgi:hypothetical protein